MSPTHARANELVALSATEMSARLDRRELSSEELVRAHLDRIEAIDGRVRAFTEVFRARALDEARRADQARARGEARGPLHGMPISVKESLDVAGLAATMGIPSRRNVVAKEDATVVQQLREAGAVVIGRTNVAQCLMFHESRNPLFGQCANPFSLAHTPGGSSGGEAAALAAGMSPLGLGTDVGGSIRVPAHFAGVAGLKPGPDRWSNRGSNTPMPGQEAIRGQIGPMARTARDVSLLARSLDVRAMSARDGRVAPLPIDDPKRIALRGLRVGVMPEDGVLPVSRAVRRAVERAAEALRAQGVETIPFAPQDPLGVVDRYFGAMSADGGVTVSRALEGGAVDPVLEALQRVARMPASARQVLGRALALVGERRLAALLAVIGEKRVHELYAIVADICARRIAFTAAMDEAKLDAILCPAHATPALPHGGTRDFALGGSPSMLFNVLHFPAGVVPVTRVRRDELLREAPRDRLEKIAADVDRKSLGLPVGVQIAARPWREDLVLALMMAVEEGVSGDEGFPRTPVTP
jgi:fatty acid amide hydrolase